MNDNRICIHILGKEAIPIYLGAINIEAKKHFLFTTSETENVAKYIKKELKYNGYEVGVHRIDKTGSIETDLEGLIDIYTKKMEEIGQNYPLEKHEIYFNITGGTKFMSIAVFHLMKIREYEKIVPFYVDSMKRTLIYVKDTIKKEAIDKTLTISNFLSIANFKLTTSKKTAEEIFVKVALHLNGLSASGSHKKRYIEYLNSKDDIREKIRKHYIGVLDILKEYSYTDYETIDKLIKGVWLEYYIYYKIRAYKKGIITEILLNCNIENKQSKNDTQEIDVFYTDGFSLYIVECKDKKKDKMDQIDIHKLDSITRKIGGIFSRGILIGSENLSDESSVLAKIKSANIVAGCFGKDGIKEYLKNPLDIKPKNALR